ncbi:MAG TPA: HlyD family efflux transporter periplasmic adaptor subunit [Azospirillum sp.]|nr:HlyD family efflux transporter periplasmic adaptor subunit [Azospirillum sp.]
MITPRHAANYRRPAPRIRVARWLLVAILVLTFSWLGLVTRLRVVGMGHVRAEESIVSSLFEGRIDALHVTCHDRVAEGDLLAVVANPVRAHAYREEMIEEEAAERTRRATNDGRIAVARAQLDAAEKHLAAARRHDGNATALADATERAWQAHEVPLKERIAALTARDRAREGLAGAEAAVRRRRAELERVRSDATIQAAGFEERVAAQRARADLGGNLEIRAPFDAVVTDCPRTVGDVVRPSVAIVRVQRVGSARIFIWVPAVDLHRIDKGMEAEVVIAESGRTLTGTVLNQPLEVGALPASLKRYFWQNQAWQQYAKLEVRIDDPRLVADLPGDARVDAVIRTAGRLLPLELLKSL